MSKFTVIGGLFTKETKKTMTEFFNDFGYELLATTDYGFDLINAVLKNVPDVIFTDTALYDIDGESTLRLLKEYDVPDTTVCVCVCTKDNIAFANKTLGRGADAVLSFPFDGSHFNDKLQNIISEKKNRIETRYRKKFLVSKDREIKIRVYSILRDIGLFANQSSYKYVRRAVLEAMEDLSMAENITKKLYPLLSELYGTTCVNIERAIRYSVKLSWTTGNVEILRSVFGDTVPLDSDGPTNGVFISMIAEKIRSELDDGFI